MERMARSVTGESELGDGREEPIAEGNDRGCLDRLIEALAARLRIPTEYRELAIIVARYHGIVHRAFELSPQTVLEFLEKADAFRRPERFIQVLLVCEADSRGRTGFEARAYPQLEYLRAARDAAAAVKPSATDIAQRDGAQIAAQMRLQRRRALEALRNRHPRA